MSYMGTIFRKELLRPGQFFTRRGPVEFTLDDLRQMEATGNAMLANGLCVPCPLEHQDSFPLSIEDQLANSVRHNAGWVSSFSLDKDGSLYVDLDIDDEEIARKLPTTIRFVSPQVHPVWYDGAGREWRNAITHIALTPQPVWSAQKPFGGDGSALLSLADVPTFSAWPASEPIRLSMADAWQLGWTQAQTRSGKTVWVGNAEHQGQRRQQEKMPGSRGKGKPAAPAAPQQAKPAEQPAEKPQQPAAQPQQQPAAQQQPQQGQQQPFSPEQWHAEATAVRDELRKNAQSPEAQAMLQRIEAILAHAEKHVPKAGQQPGAAAPAAPKPKSRAAKPAATVSPQPPASEKLDLASLGEDGGSNARDSRKRVLDLAQRTLNAGSELNAGPQNGLIDMSAATDLIDAAEKVRAGKPVDLIDPYGGALRFAAEKAARNWYPDETSANEANKIAEELLALVPDEHVQQAAASAQLPFLDRIHGAKTGGTYPAFLDKGMPAYAKFLRERLGASPKQAESAPATRPAAPTGGNSFDALQQAHAEIDRGNPALAGTVPLAQLYEKVKAAGGATNLQQFKQQLQKWEDEGKVRLRVHDSPNESERAGMIESQQGYLGYVRMQPQGGAKPTAAPAVPTPPAKAKPAPTPPADHSKALAAVKGKGLDAAMTAVRKVHESLGKKGKGALTELATKHGVTVRKSWTGAQIASALAHRRPFSCKVLHEPDFDNQENGIKHGDQG